MCFQALRMMSIEEWFADAGMPHTTYAHSSIPNDFPYFTST